MVLAYLNFQCVYNSWVAEHRPYQRKKECDQKQECDKRFLQCVAAVDVPRNTDSIDDVSRHIGHDYMKYCYSKPDKQNCTTHDTVLNMHLWTEQFE